MRLLKEWFNPKLNSEISPAPHNCSWKPVVTLLEGPCQRSQHAVCTSINCLFLYGGRGPYGCLNDLWKYNYEKHSWSVIEVAAVDDNPSSLEGHSLVSYNDNLYLFGGETSFASAGEVPLWRFNLKQSQWKKMVSDGITPVGRREHVAIIHNGKMLIHGGYIDLKGPTNEFWCFDISKNTWKLLQSFNNVYPAARYKHSGIIYEDILWICGGLMSVTDRNETQVWTWNLTSFFWSPIKIRGAPSQLFNHDCCLVCDKVFIFGGNQENGQVSSKLWEASMTELVSKQSQSWRACQFYDKVTPSPSCNHCLVVLPSAFLFFPKSSQGLRDTGFMDDSTWNEGEKSVDLFQATPFENANSCLQAEDALSSCPSSSSSLSSRSGCKNTQLNLAKDDSGLLEMDKNALRNSSNISGGEICGANEEVRSKQSLLQSLEKGDCGVQTVLKCHLNEHDGYINKSYTKSPRLFENEAVMQFSYNFTAISHQSKPIHSKTGKQYYKTTSFMDNFPPDATASMHLADELKSEEVASVKFSKTDSDDQVILPNSFYENSDKLLEVEHSFKKPEFVQVKKRNPEESQATLLLLGGSSKTRSFHLKEPIHLWKCNIRLSDPVSY